MSRCAAMQSGPRGIALLKVAVQHSTTNKYAQLLRTQLDQRPLYLHIGTNGALSHARLRPFDTLTMAAAEIVMTLFGDPQEAQKHYLLYAANNVTGDDERKAQTLAFKEVIKCDDVWRSQGYRIDDVDGSADEVGGNLLSLKVTKDQCA